MHRSVRIHAIAAFLAASSLALAQAPVVTAVLNAATHEPKLSPGVVAEVSYGPLAPADLQHSYPNIPAWPSNETVLVEVNGFKAWVTGIRAVQGTAGGIATILVPREAQVGLNKLVLINGRGSSASFNIFLDQYSPGLTDLWTECRDGSQLGHLSSIGLGPSNPPSSTFSQWVNGQPQYTTAVKPTVTIHGAEAEVLDSLAYPWLNGYQLTFRTPAEITEGTYPVVLTIGGFASNSMDLLVGTESYLAAGRKPRVAAPESLVAAIGCPFPLATASATADPKIPTTILAGTTVKITDSAGTERLAPLLSVSRTQVYYIVPAGTASGKAGVAITAGDGTVTHSQLEISTVEPGLFCAPYPECGWSQHPLGYIVRVRDGKQTIEVIQPGYWGDDEDIAAGPETDQLYLVLFGTGFRNRSSLANVSVTVLNFDTQVEYAGPQGEYAGFDQLNVRLLRRPAGTPPDPGAPLVQLKVDGKVAGGSVYLGLFQ